MALTKVTYVDNQTVIEAAQLNAIQDELIRVAGLLGKDIQSAAINDSGHLILTLTDGTTLDAGVAKGAQGATGPAGAYGKSAYQYAQDGGYTGTEEEFAAKMAAEIPTFDYITEEVEDEIACTGITLDKSVLTFNSAGQQTIIATMTPANTTDALKWTSDNPAVAAVSDGVVTAYANGSATITATCGGHSASCTVEVSGITDTVAVTGITLNQNTASVQVGDTITLTATVEPDNATNKTVTWTSDNEPVATVEDGVVTGVSEGTVSIGAMTADGGFSAVCNVTVAAASVYKNLFDKDTMVVGGGINNNGINTSLNWGMAKVPVKENTVYSLKTTDTEYDVPYYNSVHAGSIGFADSTGNTLIHNICLGDPSNEMVNADLKEYAHGTITNYSAGGKGVEWITFTTPAGCAYLLFNTTLKKNADKIQLEEGDTIHSYYLPYDGGES